MRNERGEQQIAGYLDYFHAQTGYLLSFCFNKNKQPGVKTVQIDDKTIVECVVWYEEYLLKYSGLRESKCDGLREYALLSHKNVAL